ADAHARELGALEEARRSAERERGQQLQQLLEERDAMAREHASALGAAQRRVAELEERAQAAATSTEMTQKSRQVAELMGELAGQTAR
ncbi:unnamed protein product, partial [Prorocentrum cordatum]